MTTYIVRRTLAAVPVLVIISVLVFVLSRLAPGNPIELMFDPDLSAIDPEYVERRSAELGLDQPIFVQYVVWLREVAQGNMGYSIVTGRPALEMVTERIPATVVLMVSAMSIAVVVGVPLGIIAGLRKNTWIDYTTAVVSLTSISIPAFFLALAAIFFFSLKLGLLPSAGMAPPGQFISLEYLIMPAGIAGFALAGPLVRYVRSGMLEELGKEYVQTAIAKGASTPRVVVRHALRNSLIPLITVIALFIPALLSGLVVLEQIFAWPGMGRLALRAIGNQDYPVVLTFALFVAVFVIFFNLLADILYAVADARIRLQ